MTGKVAGALTFSAVLAAAAAGCDQGSPRDEVTQGPYVQVVDVNVGPGRPPLPADGTILVSFDRLLNPLSVARQFFVVRRADGSIAANPVVTYDPVTRTVAISSPNEQTAVWLDEGQFYTLTLGIPPGDSDVGGVRAIDRAPLDPSLPPETRVYSFVVGPPAASPPAPEMRFCEDVFPLFRLKCSQGDCHGAPTARSTSRPASSLVLGSAEGVRNTAIGRVAEGANTGPRPLPQPPRRLFGVDMPIIEPGSPGNSWLMYKLLLGVPPVVPNPPTCANGVMDGDEDDVDCGGPCLACTPACDGNSARPRTVPPPAVGVVPLSPSERGVLSNYVLGREMPYPPRPADPPGSPSSNPPLTVEEMQRIRLWIAQGARVDECGCAN